MVKTKQLNFYFTEDGFRLDDRESELSENALSWIREFEENRFQALYHLGFMEKPEEFDQTGGYLHQLADTFLRVLTGQPDLELTREKAVVVPDEEVMERLLASVPFSLGSEYVTEQWIYGIFETLNAIFVEEIQEYEGSVAMYLAGKSQHLKVPERIFFHLVESKEEGYPFAFLATYATKDEEGKVQHVPLRYALTEYKAERDKLLELLSCLNQVSEVSKIIGEFVEKGEMFHPLRLTSEEAYQILKDIPLIEEAGIVCRIPNWWRKNAYSVSMSVSLGEDKPTFVGLDSILSMRPKLTVDGVALTEKEIRDLLARTEGLSFLKGKWIEVNHDKLKRLLEAMEGYEGELTLMDALRMGLGKNKENESADVGTLVTNGAWLSKLLRDLRSPGQIRSVALPKSFRAQLRHYQQTGFTWLNYMNKLGFGACLADDMGLGKTVQVLAFLEKMRTTKKAEKALLIVPASLLGNWQKEAAKFAPKMSVHILHGKGAKLLGEELRENQAFLVITTYGMASRIQELEKEVWDCLILDEAQAIKNPLTNQTKRIKKIKSRMKIAMTGTPIENELTNLWSLFDFLNKGLLGTSSEFKDYCKGLTQHPEGYARLKNMIAPFMLRRVKTDKTIISDLPDKMEQVDYVMISKKQRVLYRKQVSDLEAKLHKAEGIERRGLVLASLMKLKQICNHPDQYLGQQTYSEKDSGKFELLRSLCETIYEKRERVLIFTQFKEITEYLNEFLAEVFHAKGYVLHGGTPVAKRNEIVENFQGERYVPYIILSVRAGGTGLNLTNASHVIHFDRWWNPAVENQATDRAYRIGQKKNVMVHKFVCRGTIEEKIDEMISSKLELAQNVIGSGGENWITEMSNEELLSALRLE